MSERFLRASAIAPMLNVRTSTVYALCRRGEIPHVRLSEGRRRPLIRFRMSEIEKFLRDRTIAPQVRAE